MEIMLEIMVKKFTDDAALGKFSSIDEIRSYL